MAKLHIIVVLYNSAGALPGFLRSLLAQTMTDWRVIAVDNRSHDAAPSLVEACGDRRVRLIRNSTNLGFARAANQGLRAAACEGAETFVVFNPDTLFAPDFLAGLLDRQRATGALVMAPRIMWADQPGQAWYAGGRFTADWVFRNVHEPYDPLEQFSRNVDFASGCCLMLSREVLELVGLLDERFFVYWEDVDYCLRLRRHGIAITYVPDLVLLHEGGASSGGEFSAGYSALYHRSHMMLLRKHFGLRSAAGAAARLLKAAALARRIDWGVLRQGLTMFAGVLAPGRATEALPARISGAAPRG